MQLKKYLQDRPILFLNIAIIFIAIYCILAPIIKVDTSGATAIVSHLPYLGQIDGPQKGSPYELYSFAIAGIIFTIAGIYFAARMHQFKRSYAVTILMLTIVLLVFNIFVGEAIFNINE